MTFALPFELRRTALVNIVTHLIQGSVSDDTQEWKTNWEDATTIAVLGKIERFDSLPILLKMELSAILEPIIVHYSTAKDVFSEHAPETSARSILKSIQISPLGTVDFHRSATTLIGLSTEEMSNLQKYRLARVFCLQDTLTSIFQALTPYERVSESNSNVVPGNFLQAVLEGNEAAARRFWSTTDTVAVSKKLALLVRSKINRGRFQAPHLQKLLSSLLLFVVSSCPTDERLQEVLFRSVPFLDSLFEWPFLDILVKIVDRLKGSRRAAMLFYLNFEIFEREDFYQFLLGDYYFTMRHIWKALVTTDVDKSTGWLTLACWFIFRLLYIPKLSDGRFVRFAKLFLEDLDTKDKVTVCDVESNFIFPIIFGSHFSRLEWLYSVCLTDDQAFQLKKNLLNSINVREFCRYLLINDGREDLVRCFWKFCGVSEDRFGDMTSELTRHTHSMNPLPLMDTSGTGTIMNMMRGL